MNNENTNKAPSHGVYVVEGEGENAFWTRIGSAWGHRDGKGLNLTLSTVPLTGRVVVRVPKENKQQEAGR